MKNTRLPLLGIYILLTTYPGFTQDILWERSYGGLQSEYLFDAQPTADYGFILAGSSLSGKSGNKADERTYNMDYWLWKMDEKGNAEWQKSIGGNGNDLLKSIQGTADGGFILGGTSTSSEGFSKKSESRGKEDIWIIKLNAKGEEQWQVTIGGSGRDLIKEIKPTRDGGYIVGGSSDSYPKADQEEQGEKMSDRYGNMDYWVIKLDNTGHIEWEKTYGGIYRDELQSISQTPDQGYIVGGHSNSPVSGNKNEDNFGESDYWILKLDVQGNILWQRTIGGEGDDRLFTIVPLKNGRYVAGGVSNSGATGRKSLSNGKGTDIWIFWLDEYGEIENQKTYDFGETDILTSMIENEDGTLLIGGYVQAENLGKNKNRAEKKGIDDYLALKIDSVGEISWKSVVGSTGKDVLTKLIETRDGGYILAGSSNGDASRDKNSNNGRNDFWVVKLRDKEKEEKLRANTLEAIPNPVDTYTNVIVNHEFEKGSVTVYDILGKQLQHFKITSRTIPVNMEGYAEGIYLVKVATNVRTESVKILKGINRN